MNELVDLISQLFTPRSVSLTLVVLAIAAILLAVGGSR